MPEVISDTSPLQYLHQTDLLHLLPALYTRVIISPAVAGEIAHGRALGLALPDPGELAWIELRDVRQRPAPAMMRGLGAGEADTLALGLESPGSLLLLDDRLARRRAGLLGLRFTGTLGVLLKAKQIGILGSVAPVLDRFLSLGFRVAPATRAATLRLAGEPLE